MAFLGKVFPMDLRRTIVVEALMGKKYLDAAVISRLNDVS